MGIVYELRIGPYKQIGSTHNLEERKYHHSNLLTKGKHYNTFLQRVYDKYKTLTIVELCKFPTRQEGYKKEQELLDYFYRQPYYTMEHPMAIGGSKPGKDNPNHGKKRPEHALKLKQRWEEGAYNDRDYTACRESAKKRRGTVFCKDSQGNKLRVSKTEFDQRKDLQGLTANNSVPSRWKKVECITDSLIFNSLKEAADYYKTSAGNISENITKGKVVGLKKLGKALTFRYLI